MNRVTITLTIDLPDGVVPDVGYSSTPQEPPYVAEFPPFAEVPKYDPDERAQGTVQREAAPFCSTHNVAMKRYPAGVSKKTGKPYNASWRCDVKDCSTAPIWDRDAA